MLNTFVGLVDISADMFMSATLQDAAYGLVLGRQAENLLKNLVGKQVVLRGRRATLVSFNPVPVSNSFYQSTWNMTWNFTDETSINEFKAGLSTLVGIGVNQINIISSVNSGFADQVFSGGGILGIAFIGVLALGAVWLFTRS